MKTILPILKIDTINDKYSINDAELKTIKSLSINLKSDDPFGLVRIEFYSDVLVTGELMHDRYFKGKIIDALKK